MAHGKSAATSTWAEMWRATPPAVRAHAGHGLNNMRRGILELGGQFELTAAPGDGTRVALQVPLPRS